VTALAAISVTLALATASYWLLERPMLRLKGRFTQQAHWAPPAKHVGV
jgi:peptidoglycan/LPS O-acetylase OafA/YrhL